MSMARGAVGR